MSGVNMPKWLAVLALGGGTVLSLLRSFWFWLVVLGALMVWILLKGSVL